MERMKPPRLPETPPPVLRDAELKRLLDVCAADKTFLGRRDEAILTVFMDTGCRRGELLGLTLGDADMDSGTLRVTGKGSRGPAHRGRSHRLAEALDGRGVTPPEAADD